jgi:hypothetical protein
MQNHEHGVWGGTDEKERAVGRALLGPDFASTITAITPEPIEGDETLMLLPALG